MAWPIETTTRSRVRFRRFAPGANAACPTRSSPTIRPCVGVLTAAVAAAVPSATPIVVGKPHPFMIEQALKHLGTRKEETVMIGDQISTDIVAGQSAGLRAILIANDVPFDAVEGVVPDLIISSLLDLVGAASGETGAA